jgi:membrane protease YdiL (CAAX protease family)
VIVIALGILPHMSAYLYAWSNLDRPQMQHGASYYLYGIARNIQIVLPLVWIMFRSGKAWNYFGLVRFKPQIDIPVALLVVVGILVVHWTVGYGFRLLDFFFPAISAAFNAAGQDAVGLKAMHAPITDRATWIALTLYMFANGIGEEFVLRGYLLARIRELTGKPVLSVTLVSALAAAYHLYQGSTAALTIFAGQVVICLLYLKFPRVWAFAFGHGLYDLMVTVLWSI